ncbi:MAG TPA: aminodeoxychorismate synthase component I [Candidatus Macondimonas sp.]|nr:aminodeoxychorismate synthase component I [Candidatus Macondimonas sp.]
MPTATAVHVQKLPQRPDLLALHASFPARYPLLLESAAAHPLTGRYDLLPAFPETLIAARQYGADFLRDLADACRLTPAATDDHGLPFVGGWIAYLGYELAGAIESRLRLPQPADSSLPMALAWRCPAALIHDHVRSESWAVAEREPDLGRLLADLSEIRTPSTALPTCRLTEQDPPQYLAAIARAKDYIRAGDIFQANLSRRWQADFVAPAAPEAVYARLRHTNPAPYAASLRWGDVAVLSSSPERLLQVKAGWIQTRPIAGTRGRASDPAEDDALARELLAHPKERAEHVMLVDLERNDLGRICRPGTVRVSERLQVETYAHVHHIVSAVEGKLRAEVDVAAILAALFPGGTITGCPKVRCMEIIAELEGEARGPYTGSIGYVSRNGRMDFNILIRTAHLEGCQLSFRAGGGIVADSDPARELAETRVKAKGILQALEAASC